MMCRTHCATMAMTIVFATSVGGCGRVERTEPTPTAPKVHVETIVASERLVPKVLPLSGTLAADQRTDLAANAAGRVVKTFAERGQHVTKGYVLAQLDSRTALLGVNEAEANVQSATASRSNAAADCTRYDALIAKGAITQQEYDKAMAQCRTTSASEAAAVARAREASQSLSDATIRAPFTGTVTERFVNVGDYVKSDTRVVTLLQDDTLRLKLTVPEASLGYVHDGQQVSFETVARPGKTFTAVVRYVGGEIRSATRDMVFEASVDNEAHELVPGMFVTVKLATGEEPLAVVPRTAVVDSGGTPTVFAVVDGKLQQRSVRIGELLGTDVTVRDGITRGDRIVATPNDKTPDGASVD